MAEHILIRHGESVANAGKATADENGIGLSLRGSRQATRIPDVLLSNHITPKRIAVSHNFRTLATAQPTLDRFGITPEFWNNDEFDYLGSIKGRPTTYTERTAIRDAYWERSDPDYRDGDAETFREFMLRTKNIVDILRDSQESMIVFGHQITMHAMHWWMQQQGNVAITHEVMVAFRDNYYRNKAREITNTEVIKVDMQEGKWETIYKPPAESDQ